MASELVQTSLKDTGRTCFFNIFGYTWKHVLLLKRGIKSNTSKLRSEKERKYLKAF